MSLTRLLLVCGLLCVLGVSMGLAGLVLVVGVLSILGLLSCTVYVILAAIGGDAEGRVSASRGAWFCLLGLGLVSLLSAFFR